MTDKEESGWTSILCEPLYVYSAAATTHHDEDADDDSSLASDADSGCIKNNWDQVWNHEGDAGFVYTDESQFLWQNSEYRGSSLQGENNILDPKSGSISKKQERKTKTVIRTYEEGMLPSSKVSSSSKCSNGKNKPVQTTFDGSKTVTQKTEDNKKSRRGSYKMGLGSLISSVAANLDAPELESTMMLIHAPNSRRIPLNAYSFDGITSQWTMCLRH